MNKSFESTINDKKLSPDQNKDFKLMSINEVRKILKIRHSTIREMIDEGKLKAIKIKNRFRISTQQLDEFLRMNSEVTSDNNTIHLNTSHLKDQINELINQKKGK